MSELPPAPPTLEAKSLLALSLEASGSTGHGIAPKDSRYSVEYEFLASKIAPSSRVTIPPDVAAAWLLL